jgi:hypothetical protein
MFIHVVKPLLKATPDMVKPLLKAAPGSVVVRVGLYLDENRFMC